MLMDFPHPLVITYIDSFKDKDDFAYLVTEFAECLDLYNDMKKRFDAELKYSD
jgi:hypothetical protein